MRLHLPKGLLAALLAACFALPSEAATTVTVGTYTDSTFDSVTTVTGTAGFPTSAPVTNDAIWVSGSRIEVNQADSVKLNNEDVVIVGSGTYQADGAESSTSVTSGQIFLQGWNQGSAIDVTSKIILGSVSQGTDNQGAGLRFGANGAHEVKVSGDIVLGTDAKITATGAHAVISGNISGEGKTLTIAQHPGTGVATMALTGASGSTINLGGLTFSGSITVNMNYASATVGNLTLSSTAFTNSGSLTIGGDGKTLTLNTVLGGSGTVEIKDSTTVNVSESLLQSVGIKDFSATENGFATVSRADISSIISGILTLGNSITWKSGTTNLTNTDGVISGFTALTTTEYHIVNESVTWSDATSATSLFVADNLTVAGGSEVPTTVGTFNIGADSTLSMDSLSGEKTVNGEGTLSLGSLSGTTTILGSGHVDITGNISLSSGSLTLKNNADGAMVTLYGTNNLQMIDLKSRDITAHMTLAAGSTTTLSASTEETHGLWMHSVSTLDILKEERDGSGNLIKAGGKLSFVSGTAGATISATDQDASISATTGAHFAFNSTAFTLTNAEFRANASAGSITLSNKLVNAIVVNDSSNVLTVNNAENTLRGVEATGGNIKFAADAKVTGDIKIASDKSVIVNPGAALTHDGFTYDDSTIKTSNAGAALSLWNNAVVTGGTLTQKENSGDGYKEIGATLTNVKLVNTGDHVTWLTAQSDTLSGMEIAGTLRVGQDDRTIDPNTQELKGTFKKANVTVSGAATVGTLKVDTESTLELAGQDTNSSITTLTGSGTLKTTAGSATVTDASGFTGALAATGGKLEATTTGSPTIAALTADGGDIDVFGVTSLTVKDMVIGDGSTVGVYSGADASSSEGGLNISGNADAKASLTIGSGATLNTNLSLWNAKLTFQDGALAMGSSLTLFPDGSSELYINIGTMEAGDSLTLFTGVDQFQASADAATIDEASKVFGNLTAGDFKLTYSGADHGGIVALVAQRAVPEPTTATLSLLALMGLAARRRRRKA